MNIPFSDTVLTLTRYDRSLVKFYPYKDNDTYYIECYMIKKAYMTDNYADIQNVNIKFYSKDLLATLVFDLTNVNKIVFYDDTELDLTAFNVVPVNRDYYSNITKETPVKDSIKIVNVYQYGYFEFNLVNLDVVPADEKQFLTDWYSLEEQYLFPVSSELLTDFTSTEETL